MVASADGGRTLMLHSLRELENFRVDALDGEIGAVVDFLFDDVGWLVRHLVVETGGWLSGRKVLLNPGAVAPPDAARRAVPVNLTRETIANSPPVGADAPVTLQQEARLRASYGWPNRRSAPENGLLAPTAREVVESQVRGIAITNAESDPHLQSVRGVTGYRVDASDGHAGHVEDFIVDGETWAIRYLVVGTGHVLPGKSVLLSPRWASEVRWADETVVLDLTREKIERAPEFRADEPLNRDDGERPHDSHGPPGPA